MGCSGGELEFVAEVFGIVEIAEEIRPEFIEIALANRQAEDRAQLESFAIDLDQGLAACGIGNDGDTAAHLHPADLFPFFSVTVNGGRGPGRPGEIAAVQAGGGRKPEEREILAGDVEQGRNAWFSLFSDRGQRQRLLRAQEGRDGFALFCRGGHFGDS